MSKNSRNCDWVTKYDPFYDYSKYIDLYPDEAFNSEGKLKHALRFEMHDPGGFEYHFLGIVNSGIVNSGTVDFSVMHAYDIIHDTMGHRINTLYILDSVPEHKVKSLVMQYIDELFEVQEAINTKVLSDEFSKAVEKYAGALNSAWPEGSEHEDSNRNLIRVSVNAKVSATK